MSSSTLPTPASADAHGAGCSHCDDSVPHEHIDVRAELTAAARRSRTRSALVCTIAAVPLVVGLVGTFVTGDGARAGLLALVVAVGWLIASALGVLLVRHLGRRSSRLGLAAGAATTAALGPVIGLAGAALTGVSPVVWTTLVAGGAWWAASAIADALATVAWRRSLFEPGDAAEAARVQAIAGRDEGLDLPLAWLVQGPAVGVAAILSGPLAAAVVLLAALCAALSVRGSARRR
ncbi:hypothetical protein ACPYO6_12350 [Georgenia sp. Z1344]|uniref:hypothetical protein n=1 Tax=Georgenia sp. Z1344 TaxID=3416706 RepID=UPI003CE9687F